MGEEFKNYFFCESKKAPKQNKDANSEGLKRMEESIQSETSSNIDVLYKIS